MPSAAAGAVTSTELQQSIFNAPPSAATTTSTVPAPATLKPPHSAADHAIEDARSPTNSVAGQKRRRGEEEEEEEEEKPEEDSEGDVAMAEDSDEE
jgi:U2 small nuclear ribonucleoprotein B''